MDNAPPPTTPPPSAPPLSPAPANPDAARSWAMWCHLSALAGLAVPFGNVLGPLILWQMKRSEFPIVEDHGRESLNFQLSALIYLIGGGIIAVLGMFFCLGFLLLPVLLVIHFGALVLCVIAGIKANEGVLYRYPLNLRLIK
jgi:uncharacterized Tic20 family protein